jgi:hypothetical protein
MPIWTYMRTVLESGAMPLPPVKIDPADRETLIRWLDAGAPALLASSLCEPVVDSDGGNDTEAGPLSSADDAGSGAGDAGEEMAAAMTPDGAGASDAGETCFSNDGSAPAD